MNFKRSLSLTLAALSLTGTLAACSANASAPQSQPPAVPAVSPLASVQTQEAKIPKYVFLFIGDGMSYPQFQAASDYLGALADTGSDDILDGNVPLTFMNFPVAGSAVTYDSSSFCPDSASTATSLSTGYKTYSGTINMDETATVSYETISEKLHAQLGWKVGVISSVNLNHATPAAFYAHQAKRSNYYEIGQELVASNFEYFAGGGLLKPTGPDKDKTSLYDLAADAGYKVVMTQAEAEAVTSADGKVLIIDEHLADSDAFAYENDRADGNWALSDYVKKGIEVLDNDTGFFLMVEGGKIDWACHANDAGSTIADTIALSDAVEEAVAAYRSLGADIVEFRLPSLQYALPVYYILACAEASSNLGRYDGIRYGYKTAHYEDVNDMICKTRSEGFGKEVQRRILLGTYVLSAGYYDAYYKKAQNLRGAIVSAFDEAFRSCDVILAPTVPMTAFKRGFTSQDPVETYQTDICTVPVNIAGLPAVSLPCGYDAAGLPIGIQLIGPRFGEAAILNAAYQYEQQAGAALYRPTGWGVSL